MLPALASPLRAKVAIDDARALASLLGLAVPVHILDVGCGAGMHAIELARLGHAVTGLDRTAALLAVARERSAGAGVQVAWLLADMRDFALDTPVDVALSLYASFGYFESRDEDLATLHSIHRALAPGGRAVLDVLGKEIAGAAFAPRSWATFEGVTLLEERSILPGWEWTESRWTILQGAETRKHVTRQRLYSAVELRDLLREVGFGRVDVFGGLDGRPYDRSAQRLVAVAQRG
jgi:SAM-dependent methyltransferase